jgi:CRP/FNR family transcriptional regulator
MIDNQCSCNGCELRTLFFENLEKGEYESMCVKKQQQLHPKGSLIYKQGEKIDHFSYLKSGLVKLVRNIDDNNEQIICFARPLDFVSLLSIFSETYHQYSVIALEDSEICSLYLDEVKEMALHNGRFALSLAEKINRASDNIILTMLNIRQRRLLGRIAYILLYFANEVYKSDVFDMPVSRKEIAEFIGMTTENVIRTLSEFRQDKIIKINGKTIEIVDKEKLEHISQNA